MPFQALEGQPRGATKFSQEEPQKGNRVYTVSAVDCRRGYVQCIVKREKPLFEDLQGDALTCKTLHAL